MKKVGTKDNPADVLTKGFKRELIDRHVEFLGGTICCDRANAALSIHWMSGAKVYKRRSGPKPNILQVGGDT